MAENVPDPKKNVGYDARHVITMLHVRYESDSLKTFREIRFRMDGRTDGHQFGESSLN